MCSHDFVPWCITLFHILLFLLHAYFKAIIAPCYKNIEDSENIWTCALLLATLFQDSVVQSSEIMRTIPLLATLLKCNDILLATLLNIMDFDILLLNHWLALCPLEAEVSSLLLLVLVLSWVLYP
jgi:hypothetical protein